MKKTWRNLYFGTSKDDSKEKRLHGCCHMRDMFTEFKQSGTCDIGDLSTISYLSLSLREV